MRCPECKGEYKMLPHTCSRCGENFCSAQCTVMHCDRKMGPVKKVNKLL